MRTNFLLAINFIFYISMAQNLVPNPNFEECGQCPTDLHQLHHAKGWTINIGSADYYHACGTPNVFSVPKNCFGYQCAASGVAYAGIYCYWSLVSNSREYLGTKLITPLEEGKKYYVSVKFNLSDISKYAINKLGVKFTNVQYPESVIIPFHKHKYLLNNFAHVYTNEIIKSKKRWTVVFGSFIADSSYEYILIGNFFDDNNISIIITDPQLTANKAYYYVDDVCVSEDSLECIIPDSPIECDTLLDTVYVTPLVMDELVIYPNPVYDKLNIRLSGNELIKVVIYDLFGRSLYKGEHFSREIEINMESLNEGVYILCIVQNQKTFYRKITKKNKSL